MDVVKVRSFLGLMSLVLASAYFALFHLDLGNAVVVVFLKLVSVIILPALICFSWLIFWEDNLDPFRYLSQWNCGTQILFLALNLLRVPPPQWGVPVWLYVGLSAVIVALYVTRLHDTKWGFFTTGGLMLVNVVMVFVVTLTTFEVMHPFFTASPLEPVRYLGGFVTELALMGAVYSSSSQLYWHDILTKRHEEAYMEHLFIQLEEEAALRQTPETPRKLKKQRAA